MTEDFDPEQYHDSYREALEQPAAARWTAWPREPAERPAAEPVSLLDALQASLHAAGKDRTAYCKRPPRKRASA